MQLQNKETKIKYSITLDQDEMNDLIASMERLNAYIPGLSSTERIILDSLRSFRGQENEPTEQELQPRTIMTPVLRNL